MILNLHNFPVLSCVCCECVTNKFGNITEICLYCCFIVVGSTIETLCHLLNYPQKQYPNSAITG